MPESEPDLKVFTTGELAAWLTEHGCSVNSDTVRRWCRKGRIPAAVTPGGEYLIRREDAQAILTPVPAEG